MFRSLLVIAIALMSNLAAADVSWKWTGTMKTNGSRIPVLVVLNQHNQDTSGTVAIDDDAKPLPLEKAGIRGDTVTFEVHDSTGRVIGFRLLLSGAALRGEATVGGQISNVSLFRADRRVYRVGNGVAAPSVVRKVDPGYSEAALRAKCQGTVILVAEIDPDGAATNIRVQRGLGFGLDEKAIEAVRQWEFKPGIKDGEPVTVAATIEVNFRLKRWWTIWDRLTSRSER